jgi:hypothetical protein
MAAATVEHGYARAVANMAASPRPSDFAEAAPFPPKPQTQISHKQLTDLDIPTFIRRQMD